MAKRFLQITPATTPAPTFSGSHSYTYDDTNDVVVFTCGAVGPASPGLTNETYTFDGTDWTLQSPASKPATRIAPAFAYDPRSGECVLFGGYDGSGGLGVLSDTWLWDGSVPSWTNAAPAANPSARIGAGLAWDGTDLILFGGSGFSSISNNETWKWTGTNWVQLTPANSPSARYSHTMEYDSVRGKIVLYGGLTISGVDDETWEWDGTDWTEVFPAATPGGLAEMAYTYDATRQTIVTYGGYHTIAAPLPRTDEVWEYDGTTWLQTLTCATAGDLVGQVFQYDPILGLMVVYGGTLVANQIDNQDTTWLYPYPCPGVQVIRWW